VCRVKIHNARLIGYFSIHAYIQIGEKVLPMRGTASLVRGMISDTMFMNTVRLSRIVTPAGGSIVITGSCDTVQGKAFVMVGIAMPNNHKYN
jgi:hypothetical protein